MKAILVILLASLIFFSCTKDKYETNPQIDIKSFSPEEAVNKDIITLIAEITDKEGDLVDSLLIVRKRFNVGTEQLLSEDTLSRYLGDIGNPDKSKIEIEITFSYGEIKDFPTILLNQESNDRKFSIGLIAVDKAGHRSEYKETKKIILKKV